MNQRQAIIAELRRLNMASMSSEQLVRAKKLFVELGNALARHAAKAPNPWQRGVHAIHKRIGRSKYKPHQGKQEMERRRVA
jgi:hypothetical protein